MKLEDAMLEAIMLDVLANPGNYTADLAARARLYDNILTDNEGCGRLSQGWPGCTERWAERVSEFLKNRDLEK